MVLTADGFQKCLGYSYTFLLHTWKSAGLIVIFIRICMHIYGILLGLHYTSGLI